MGYYWSIGVILLLVLEEGFHYSFHVTSVYTYAEINPLQKPPNLIWRIVVTPDVSGYF
jgi:hypothetical protein